MFLLNIAMLLNELIIVLIIQGRHILTKRGYTDADRREANPTKEHIAVFEHTALRVAERIDKLFS